MEAALPIGDSYQLRVRGHALDVRNSLNDRQLDLLVLWDPFHRSFLLQMSHDLGTVY